MELIVEIIAGLVVVVPLVVALITYVVKCTKEKNWKALVQLALVYIAEAEKLYQSGAEKKEYVVKMLIASAKELNYDISEEAISALIENIIKVTKEVNVTPVSN